MSHFAKVENGIVTQVIVIEQDVVDTGHWGNPALWIQTSYNTQGGQHILGGTPLRKNYAGSEKETVRKTRGHQGQDRDRSRRRSGSESRRNRLGVRRPAVSIGPCTSCNDSCMGSRWERFSKLPIATELPNLFVAGGSPADDAAPGRSNPTGFVSNESCSARPYHQWPCYQ